MRIWSVVTTIGLISTPLFAGGNSKESVDKVNTAITNLFRLVHQDAELDVAKAEADVAEEKKVLDGIKGEHNKLRELPYSKEKTTQSAEIRKRETEQELKMKSLQDIVSEKRVAVTQRYTHWHPFLKISFEHKAIVDEIKKPGIFSFGGTEFKIGEDNYMAYQLQRALLIYLIGQEPDETALPASAQGYLEIDTSFNRQGYPLTWILTQPDLCRKAAQKLRDMAGYHVDSEQPNEQQQKEFDYKLKEAIREVLVNNIEGATLVKDKLDLTTSCQKWAKAWWAAIELQNQTRTEEDAAIARRVKVSSREAKEAPPPYKQ